MKPTIKNKMWGEYIRHNYDENEGKGAFWISVGILALEFSLVLVATAVIGLLAWAIIG